MLKKKEEKINIQSNGEMFYINKVKINRGFGPPAFEGAVTFIVNGIL